MIHDADQIIPHLWLGNFDSSQNREFIIRNHITVIVNCTKDLPFPNFKGIYKYRVPVDDNLQRKEIISMSKWIGRILPVIMRHYKQKQNILIHCAAGMQRSAIVVLSFLYKYCIPDAVLAYFLIKNKRPIAFTPNMNFKNSFTSYFGENIQFV